MKPLFNSKPEEEGGTALPPPSALDCPKCGSDDIHRRFWLEGEHWTRQDLTYREGSNEFIRVEKWAVYAMRDCVTHRCQTCQWDWSTAPLGGADRAKLMGTKPEAKQFRS